MKKHVVIIEDDTELLALMASLLEADGYRVTPLAQLDSVEELIELKPDAYVIDENLPVVNGHIICIILKSKPQTKHVPVILVSGDDKLLHMASLCEADAYLRKPFNNYQDLQHLLEKALVA